MTTSRRCGPVPGRRPTTFIVDDRVIWLRTVADIETLSGTAWNPACQARVLRESRSIPAERKSCAADVWVIHPAKRREVAGFSRRTCWPVHDPTTVAHP